MVPLRDHAPTRIVPWVTWGLLGANLALFTVQWTWMRAGASWLVPWLGLVPARMLADPGGEAFTVLSSMFMHGDWAHLAGNLLFLWIFGDNIEDALGHLRYLALYLVTGLAAAAAQILVDPASTVPMVGASGAISGVLGAYLVLYPRVNVSVLNPMPLLWMAWGVTFVLPAWVVIGEWFLLGNLLKGIATLGSSGGGVAFWAHIGGFLAGLVLIKPAMLGRAKAETDPWKGWRPPRHQPGFVVIRRG